MKTLSILSSVVLCFCFCYSCKNLRKESDPEIYIMPQHISANEDGRMEYYLPYNFIIDTGKHIYFYQREPRFSPCGNVDWWHEIRIPRYIDLMPKDIIEIPQGHLEEFIKLNILKVEENKRQVVICSPQDTVYSEGLSRIMRIFKDTSNHIQFKLRKTTQEEDFVLSYKKQPSWYYNQSEFKWDSTKTLFPEIFQRIQSEETDSLLRFYETKRSQKTEYNPESYFSSDGLMDSVKLRKWAAYLRLRDSIRFRKVAAVLGVKVEDVYINEEKR
jgi:hypothetical protein